MSDGDAGSGPRLPSLAPSNSQADVEERAPKRTRTGELSCGQRGGPQTLDECEYDVVHECKEYLVINKPADVRLDGDFSVSVEKLVHKNLPDLDKPRWIHQLDFATSGVLCIGLNKVATGNAGKLFNMRRTKKLYLAVVSGFMRFAKPGGAASGKGVHGSLVSKTTGLQGGGEEAKVLAGSPLVQSSVEEATAPRKELMGFSSVSPCGPVSLGQITPEERTHHALFKYAAEPEPVSVCESWVETSTFARPDSLTQELIKGVYHDVTSHLPCYDVKGSIAPESEGEFRMKIDEENGRNARTLVLPVEYGYMNGVPATKVLLRPVDGRRHQLRLHLLHMGFPIIGDATYGPVFCHMTGKSNSDFYDTPSRMMLHAFRLELPFLSSGLRMKNKDRGFLEGNTRDFALETVDPFNLVPG